MMGWGGQPACMNVGRDETGELAAPYSSRAEQVIGMALFGLFRRKSPIREPKELADFIDEQASSFLHESNETSRWQVYPLGLAMMGEVVDAMLRPHAGTQKRALADEMIDLCSASSIGIRSRQRSDSTPGVMRAANSHSGSIRSVRSRRKAPPTFRRNM